jgi:hypothetical protein
MHLFSREWGNVLAKNRGYAKATQADFRTSDVQKSTCSPLGYARERHISEIPVILLKSKNSKKLQCAPELEPDGFFASAPVRSKSGRIIFEVNPAKIRFRQAG